MLEFVIFAISFAVFLIAAVFYLYPGSRKLTTIPSMDPSETKDGNLPDITSAGGMHPFLMQLHETCGPLAGFWFGDQYVVSFGSAELFKEHLRVFDRPAILFKNLEPLIGAKSIQFANGPEGRQRRKCYDRYFSHVSCQEYCDTFISVGEDMVKKWASLPPKEHIPVHQYMMALALKSILLTAFGTILDEGKVVRFHRTYELVWSHLSKQVIGTKMDSENPQDKRILEAIDELHSIARDVLEERQKENKQDENIFADFLLNENMDNERRLHDCITYIIGGFHTTGNLLTWALYFLASHDDVQEKLYAELITVLGNDPPISEKLKELKYAQQIINETLRCSVLAPHAARVHDNDVEIGGHIIPKGTPILHSLGVTLYDPKTWPEPDNFDPDRFLKVKERSRSPLSFCPFGFAGQRSCPGQKFVFYEALIFLALFCRQFKLQLVEGQVVTPVYTLVTHPEDEIWITIERRK